LIHGQNVLAISVPYCVNKLIGEIEMDSNEQRDKILVVEDELIKIAENLQFYINEIDNLQTDYLKECSEIRIKLESILPTLENSTKDMRQEIIQLIQVSKDEQNNQLTMLESLEINIHNIVAQSEETQNKLIGISTPISEFIELSNESKFNEIILTQTNQIRSDINTLTSSGAALKDSIISLASTYSELISKMHTLQLGIDKIDEHIHLLFAKIDDILVANSKIDTMMISIDEIRTFLENDKSVSINSSIETVNKKLNLIDKKIENANDLTNRLFYIILFLFITGTLVAIGLVLF
jgi:hypothetical protein